MRSNGSIALPHMWRQRTEQLIEECDRVRATCERLRAKSRAIQDEVDTLERDTRENSARYYRPCFQCTNYSLHAQHSREGHEGKFREVYYLLGANMKSHFLDGISRVIREKKAPVSASTVKTFILYHKP